MSKLRVHSFSVSLDGYGAGPNQSVQEPLGVGGETLHRWIFGTRTFREMYGNKGGGNRRELARLVGRRPAGGHRREPQ